MDDEEFWDELEEEPEGDVVDLDATEEDELFDGFGEEGQYGDED